MKEKIKEWLKVIGISTLFLFGIVVFAIFLSWMFKITGLSPTSEEIHTMILEEHRQIHKELGVQ